MAWSWWRRSSSTTGVLGAVVAYLRLLSTEWESLTDAERRNAVLLALEAVEGTHYQATHGTGERDEPERPNA